MNIPEISVLVASRDRGDAIGRFLTRIESIVSSVSYEIIVADNSTINQTSGLLHNFAKRLPLHVIYVPEKGKSRSLNRAILQARGELLVFADDDIRPDRNWLDAYRQAAEERPDINIFGGRILVDKGRIPEWIARSYNLKTILLTEQDFGEQERLFGFNEYPVGPNLAVRKKVLQSLDKPWPEDVGPGSRLPVGDEGLFLRKLSASSSNDRLYVPASVVYHEFNRSNVRFGNALLRCYLGGYAAGLSSNPAGGHDYGKTTGLTGKLWDRLRTCRSLRELMCMTSRAAGYYIGTRRAVRGVTPMHKPSDRDGS